jgi:hypothetical protein
MTLTIDDMAENYRRYASANLRRLGSTRILPCVIESFRDSVTSLDGAERINQYLAWFGSHRRAFALWESTLDATPETFWRVVLENWNSCDSINPRAFHKLLLDTFRDRLQQASPLDFMQAEDRDFFDNLPDPVTAFRGCARNGVRRMPWTTDLAVAEYFASGGRFPAPNDPVIAVAEIAKADVFFVQADRQERELVLDPYRVKRVRLDDFTPAKAVQQAVQQAA